MKKFWIVAADYSKSGDYQLETMATENGITRFTTRDKAIAAAKKLAEGTDDRFIVLAASRVVTFKEETVQEPVTKLVADVAKVELRS